MWLMVIYFVGDKCGGVLQTILVWRLLDQESRNLAQNRYISLEYRNGSSYTTPVHKHYNRCQFMGIWFREPRLSDEYQYNLSGGLQIVL